MTTPAHSNPAAALAERRAASTAALDRPLLLVVVDTEEEFDWNAPFDRSAIAVEAMREIGRLQQLLDEHDIRPTYVIDHPVASQKIGRELLVEYCASGRAVIGAHLHPWVSPPYDEEVSARNSYPGNLPAALEEAKLARLSDIIEAHFDERPRVYKAGRYGFGPNTAGILARLGYQVDLSACPAFDFGADGGPDWSRFSADPYWFGPDRRLLGIPCTGAFVGWLSGAGAALHRAAHRPLLASLRAAGTLARIGALERLMLSPEGYEPRHHQRLTRALLARGARVFTFSLHSPSLRPGCTPYVRTESELLDFLARCRRYFEWFQGELGGQATTPLEVLSRLAGSAPLPQPTLRDA